MKGINDQMGDRAQLIWREMLALDPSLSHRLRGLVDDHRRLTYPALGMGFAAIPGAHFDPRDHLQEIFLKKPSVVFIESIDGWTMSKSLQTLAQEQGVTWLSVKNLSGVLGELAHQAFGLVSNTIKVFGVTGTNGKTSTVWALAHLLSTIDRPCGMIGTLGCGLLSSLSDSGMTTPSATEFHRYLARCSEQGANYCACEITSIALDQGRVRGTTFFSALFTNLTHDHLDYHGDEIAYKKAKALLFEAFPVTHAIINIDDHFGESLVNIASSKGSRVKHVWTVQFSPTSTNSQTWCWQGETPQSFSITVAPYALTASLISSSWSHHSHHFSSSWVGRHNIENLVLAIINLALLGFSPEVIQKALKDLPMPHGRLEKICLNDERALLPSVWVDYAHTPDALEKVLIILAKVAKNRGGQLWCVFGCGGNRDRGKRPIMGHLALQISDHVVVTSDNPRDEEPASIIQDIYPQPIEGVIIEVDREQAIHRAIASANIHDVILIAGKGHEDYQEIMGVRIPFSDQKIAAQALLARSRS